MRTACLPTVHQDPLQRVTLLVETGVCLAIGACPGAVACLTRPRRDINRSPKPLPNWRIRSRKPPSWASTLRERVDPRMAGGR